MVAQTVNRILEDGQSPEYLRGNLSPKAILEQYGSTFITFEGGEYSGKSTSALSVRELADEFFPFKCTLTREPGGSERAEYLRDNLKFGKPKGMRDDLWWELEAGVFYTAGGFSLEDVILPALQRPHNVVISDRWRDSTWAYQWEQGAGHCSTEYLTRLHNLHIGSFRPALSIYFEIDEDTLLRRQQVVAMSSLGEDRDGLTRYDDQNLEFHRRVWDGYRRRMEMDPFRWKVVDATQDPDIVLLDVWNIIIKYLWELENGAFWHGEQGREETLLKILEIGNYVYDTKAGEVIAKLHELERQAKSLRNP